MQPKKKITAKEKENSDSKEQKSINANNLLGEMTEAKKNNAPDSTPIIIQIKNKTDEKLYDVKLFEDNYLNHPKLEYSTPIVGVDYKKILDFVLTQSNGYKTRIGLTLISPSCSYDKFTKKQIAAPIYIKNSTITGRIETKTIIPVMDIYQNITTMIANKFIYDIEFGRNIIIDYLMPDTTVIFYLYPSTKDKITDEIENNESIPYVIEIKNLTDEKIYNVKAIDREYYKTDKSEEKVRYSLLTHNCTYEQLYFKIINRPFKVVATRIHAFCDFKEYLIKQLYCPAKLIVPDKDKNFETHSEDMVICADPYQNIIDVIISHQEYTMQLNSNIIFDYLMPEASILLYLYPKPASASEQVKNNQ